MAINGAQVRHERFKCRQPAPQRTNTSACVFRLLRHGFLYHEQKPEESEEECSASGRFSSTNLVALDVVAFLNLKLVKPSPFSKPFVDFPGIILKRFFIVREVTSIRPSLRALFPVSSDGPFPDVTTIFPTLRHLEDEPGSRLPRILSLRAGAAGLPSRPDGRHDDLRDVV